MSVAPPTDDLVDFSNYPEFAFLQDVTFGELPALIEEIGIKQIALAREMLRRVERRRNWTQRIAQAREAANRAIMLQPTTPAGLAALADLIQALATDMTKENA